MDRRALLLTVWSGVLLLALFAIGFVACARMLPPPLPSASAEVIAQRYIDNATGIRIGTVLMMFGTMLTPIWAAGIVAQTRRMEPGIPIFAYAQIGLIGATTFLGAANFVAWTVAAFRADDVSPEITRMLNDFGWFMLLWGGPLVIAWCLVIAFAIMFDRSGEPVFPRWVMYLNLWAAFLFVPGSLITFFKTGPFGYNGLFGMYVPLVAFFIWFVVMSVMVVRATPSAADGSGDVDGLTVTGSRMEVPDGSAQ